MPFKLGSPPRMRGKALSKEETPITDGITPAYAGKSQWWPPAGGRAQDHPRVCGEKYWRHSCPQMRSGSPPRMRGKAADRCTSTALAGITPAYAGKSVSYRWAVGAREDHPRVCGEKRLPPCQYGYIWGSPPRMRGKGQPAAHERQEAGITPAYAGKSR